MFLPDTFRFAGHESVQLSRGFAEVFYVVQTYRVRLAICGLRATHVPNCMSTAPNPKLFGNLLFVRHIGVHLSCGRHDLGCVAYQLLAATRSVQKCIYYAIAAPRANPESPSELPRMNFQQNPLPISARREEATETNSAKLAEVKSVISRSRAAVHVQCAGVRGDSRP